MKKKQKLGQFYTTNYKYILQNLHIPAYVKNIIEPFAGQGDLLPFVKDKNIECYDIDPKKDNIIKRDTLLDPPSYNNKFIITNPPYLARNKSKDKKIFDLYDQNDLYKCLIIELTRNQCLGGILIIPLNFWCSIRKKDINLREKFLEKYNIIAINIFEERVFCDTSYTICSFQFEVKHNAKIKHVICNIYPSKKKINFIMTADNNFTIGGEIYKLIQNKEIAVGRLTSKNKNNKGCTNILVKCIDDSLNHRINMSLVQDDKIFIDETSKLSARSYATLVINPPLSPPQQKILVEKFNQYLNKKRDLYHSLFLTNYRESTTIARKRISFNLVFRICNYLLSSE